jgi:hypothetical protein
MIKVFERVKNWNAARYEQEHNTLLTCTLLAEELNEYWTAKTEVDQLDALCDLVYVALGAIWKADVEVDELQHAQEVAVNVVSRHLDLEVFPPAYYIASYILGLRNDYLNVAESMNFVITSCLTQMSYMGLSQEQQERALLVVCDSNDSKSVKKTASNVKANDGDKGPYFKDPEPRLQEILDARVKH